MTRTLPGPSALARTTAALLLALLGLAACRDDPDRRKLSPSHLGEALALTPPDRVQVSFTDWELIKAEHGLSDVTGENSAAEQDRLDVLATVVTAPPVLRVFEGAQDVWGWNSLDLVWEAAIADQGGLVYVLKVRDDLDLKAVTGALDREGYTSEDRSGSTVYTHPGLIQAQPGADPALANIAVVDDRDLMVLAADSHGLDPVLDRLQSGDESLSADYASIVETLGEVSSAVLVDAQSLCDPGSLGTGSPSPAPEAPGFSTLAIGYRPDASLADVVYHYPDPEAAESALPVRRELLEDGTSVVNASPYAELLTVTDGAVRGDDVVITAKPVDDPSVLYDMLFNRDLQFACAEGLPD